MSLSDKRVMIECRNEDKYIQLTNKDHKRCVKEIEKLELFIKVLSSMRSDRDFFKLLLQDIDDNQSTLNSMNLIMEDISKSFR
jgi:hypothetical protein